MNPKKIDELNHPKISNRQIIIMASNLRNKIEVYKYLKNSKYSKIYLG